MKHTRFTSRMLLGFVVAAAVVAFVSQAPHVRAQSGSEPTTTLRALLLDRGVFTPIDVPCQTDASGTTETFELADINHRGRIVGFCTYADGTIRGIVRDRGAFTNVEFPGALVTAALGINDRGQIVGSYSEVGGADVLNTLRGFLLDDDVFTRIDIPGASSTDVESINNRRQMVGRYIDAAGAVHGFLLRIKQGERSMRKVIVAAMVSKDGVMQAPGGPEEDPTGGFKFGGWVAPLADVDPVFGEEIGKLFDQPFDLLLGRRTYDIFAAHWPYAEGGPYDDIARTFNRITKYVATRNGVDLTWKGSVSLRDAATEVAKLKQEDGPALVTQGSTELVHALLAAGLVDEIRTFTFPVLLGKGKRLFGDDGQPRAFELTHSAVSPNGVIAAIYARDGEVRTATVGGATEPTQAELARREKLKREAVRAVAG